MASSAPSWLKRTGRAVGRWSALLALSVALLAPVSARAAKGGDDEEAKPDGRLEGYQNAVTAEGGSATTYMFLVLLMAITAGVTFMNAKRTHLD